MVTRIVSCYHCGSKQLVKNGHAPNGKQKYLCKDCGQSSRENPAAKGYSQERKDEIMKAYQERSSLRGLTRTFGVSRTTVATWLKKSRDNPAA
jgi:transposase-like protein